MISKERQEELGIDLKKVNEHQLKEIEKYHKSKKWDGIIRIDVTKNSNFWLWAGMMTSIACVATFMNRENYAAALMSLQSIVIYIGWIKSKESK